MATKCNNEIVKQLDKGVEDGSLQVVNSACSSRPADAMVVDYVAIYEQEGICHLVSSVDDELEVIVSSDLADVKKQYKDIAAKIKATCGQAAPWEGGLYYDED